MASEGMHSPVEQFEIRPIIELAAGGYDISFTNSSLFMLLAMVVGGGFLFAAMRNRELVPGRMQGAAEILAYGTAVRVEPLGEPTAGD